LLKSRRPDGADVGPESNRILILEPYGMGDVISLEPLIRNLRQRNWNVTLAAQARWRRLFPGGTNWQWIDSTIPWTSYDSGRKYRFGSLVGPEFRSCLRQLQAAGRGAVGIDPRGDIRSVILLHLAGCRRVYSVETYLGTDLSVPAYAATTVRLPDDAKRWQVNLQFLDPLGVREGVSCLSPGLEHLRKPRDRHEPRRLGLVPVAPWAGKHWGREKWVPFIERARVNGWQPIGLGGPGQASQVAEELGVGAGLEECGDLEAWADVLQRCACVISVDSGPMHLADALGVPVIALFGQGRLPLWAPSGPRSQVIHHQHDADFVPCHSIDRNVPLGRKFMSRIEVDEVWSRLNDRAPA